MADGNYVRLGCAAEACAGELKAKGYCLRHYRQWQRGGVKQDASQCAHCGQEFTPATAGSMYCSKRCKLAEWRAANPKRNRELRRAEKPKLCAYMAKHCEICGRPGGARRDWTLCQDCSRQREREAARLSALAVAEARHKAASRVTECAECGSCFCPMYGFSLASLCAPCADERKRRYRRAAKAFRAAIKRGANGGESVDRRRVFARDGWCCRLCGIDTPESLMGGTEHNAPELDHVVPVSRGGLHTYSNTQCLCRSCNGWKSDRSMAVVMAELVA